MTTTNNARNRRVKLWEKQDGKCCYCNRPMWVKGVHEKRKNSLQATLEHKIPKAFGGKNHMENLACSCQDCNTKRGIINHNDFKLIRKQNNWMRLIKLYRNKEYRKHYFMYFMSHERHNLKSKRNGLHREISNRVKQYHSFIYI